MGRGGLAGPAAPHQTRRGKVSMHPSRTVLFAAVALPLAAAPALAAGTLELVSVSSSGAQGDDASGAPSVSADGRLVAFQSEARDLVPHDANNKFDIFVRDRQTGATELVSTNSRGAQASVGSFTPAISGDGRYVAFQSSAHNFSEFNNSFTDVFVHDRQTGTTEQVSVASSGVPGNGESGRFSGISISRKGRYVTFASEASNLVPGDTNDARDVFVRDRQAGTTERVSVGPHGAQAEGGEIGSVHPSISADGRYVAFESDATNLVPGDTNGHEDVFVRDRQAGTTERVSVGQGGAQANGDSGFAGLAISGDGRFVAFASDASNLVKGDTNGATDVFVHDRQAGTTERVSVGQGGVQAGNRSVSPS